MKQALFSRFQRIAGAWIALAAAAIVALVGWFAVDRLKQHELTNLLEELKAFNRIVLHRLDTHFQELRKEAEDRFREKELLALLRAEFAQGSAERRFRIRKALAGWMVAHGFRDFYLISPDLTLVAGMRESLRGLPAPAAVHDDLRRVMALGEAVLTHPFEADVAVVPGVRTWLLLPLAADSGGIMGVVALELGEEGDLTPLTKLVAAGSTAETYLVDGEGVMLTRSRFESQLRDLGLLDPGEHSELKLRVAVPKMQRGAGAIQGELTQAASSIVRHRGGWSLKPYPDYRGVPVLGVWEWDSTLGLGVITEIDADEAMAGYSSMRDAFWGMLATLLLFGLLLGSWYARHLRRLESEANRTRNLLLESTAEAIYGVDLNGNCTFANRACQRMLGYEDASELIGRNMHNLIHHSHADGSPYPVEDCPIYRAFRNKTRIHRRDEVFWRRDGSSFPVEYWSHPVFDERGNITGCVVSFLDITELRQAEEQRRRIEQQVQHAQRLESLGVLAGGIAHDFNNILSVILGNAALAARKVVSDPIDARNKLETIVQSCERAAVLCRQMLAYSGKGKFVVRPLNLSEVVEEITHLLEVSLNKGVVLKYALSKNLPPVVADEAQIQQLIMNLVTNANEAIGEKSGVISISTGLMQADANYLMDCYGDNPKPGRYAYIEVNDTGCGMDAETVKKIFDPFFTTKFKGRGLGMSAVLGIVRGHKGALKIYSEPGKGTSVKFLLPVEEGARIEHVGKSMDRSWRGQGLVLVVDDEVQVREAVMMMLEDMGFDTIGAENGEVAVEIYRKQWKKIVAVVMDLTMPKMGGEACFTELRRINPKVKVVLSSGYTEEDAVQHFSGKGLAAFIQKPVSPERLQKVMRRLLEGDRA